ncbi:MAG: recombinase family protein [bacterium]|nr:recombinase family protein [bacterium]
MNAIVYCRVSTQEQAETGFSLEAQQEYCANFAQHKGYNVLRTFVERGESAKTLNRTQLQLLTAFSKQNASDIDVLIVYKLDRLSRNQRDTLNFFYEFNLIGIRIESVTENIDETPEGKFITSIISAQAEYDNNKKSRRVKDVMKKAVQEGRWCWKAPTGYHFQNDQFRKPLLHPSSESEFIKEAFTLIEQGFYSQKEVTEILARKGFKVSTQTMNKILHNPIYAGLIRTKWYPELIEGIHEPLISRETFFNVQKILLGDKPSLAPKRKRQPRFSAPGICPVPGLRFTAYSERMQGKDNTHRLLLVLEE